ncbi:MAG: RES family NAD+ phosphorylase [Gammaproteobacteria bacterium]|nr:RES family NAD+ phosphorylase [Gammaproteobacteria bacterium]
MPTGWRVADPEFAKSPQEMLSGEGAFLHGGRWNTKGHRVVYLGGNLATASLELLVYLDSISVLNCFSKIEVTFNDEHIILIDPDDLPDDWTQPSMTPTTQIIGNDWLSNQESLILQIPSVVIESEHNYLLNPLHPDFKEIETSNITTFKYDSRIR